MRRGILLSLILHVMIIFITASNFTAHLFPEPEVQVMKVRLVAAKEPKQTVKKVEKKRTQQSAAPKAPPKKKKVEQVQKSKAKTKVVSNNTIKQKEPEKKEEKEQKQVKAEPETKPISRPEKLDKSPDKKNVVQDKTAEIKEQKEDDFLAALSFIAALEKTRKDATVQADEDTEPTVTEDDAQDIALLKRHVERNWYKTPGIKGIKDLVVLVELRVNRDGSLVDVKVIRSSGQLFFDNSILRAARRSAPFPIPQEKYDLFKVIELYFNGSEL